jgi:succinyl-diaminopimelate desuccinylase
LECALAHARKLGLTTKNVDGYAGHAEWAAPDVDPKAPIVGVLAHVDVVPAGDGWNSPPFAAEIVDGKIVARGALDDKGPAVAGLFAIAAVAASGLAPSRRIRLILGADEESGFECVKHYFAHEEMPATGFTPDAVFPIVYAEKGIANAVVSGPLPDGLHLTLKSMRGGSRPNMVPDFAQAVVQSQGPVESVVARLNSVVGVQAVPMEDGAGVRIAAKGVAAHGASPTEGVNALGVLFDALLMLEHEEQAEAIKRLRDWAQDTTGAALGIAGSDPVSGSLTCNLGLGELAHGHFVLTFNIRYPIDWDSSVLRARLAAGLAHTGFSLKELSDQPPLYVPLDDPLVATLLAVYRAETGDHTSEPQTMGGGTYARAMAKGVAFGPAFPGATGPGPHQANEAWAIDDLLKAAKIYAKALCRLAVS